MANLFLDLPAVAGNGTGAAVDVSALGASKTIVVASNGGTYSPTVTIEFSNDLAGTKWTTFYQIQRSGQFTRPVAARWMRVTTSNYKGGGAPTVSVGGVDLSTEFASLVAPAGNGVGAAVDVSELPPYKTIQVTDAFSGALLVEISTDGGATYGQLMGFYEPGFQSATVVADFMRLRRTGVPINNPGLPQVEMGASSGETNALTAVEHDDTLYGDGTAGSPLGVWPFAGIVLRPADPAGARGNVYLTAAAAWAALDERRALGLGPTYLIYDDTYGTITIPAGEYNVSDVIQMPAPRLPGVLVDIQDGATFIAQGKIISFTGTRLQMRYNGTGASGVTPYDGGRVCTIDAGPTGATQVGTTATFVTTTPHGLSAGRSVVVAGVGVAGYNGTHTVVATPTATSFTVTLGVSGLAASGGGTMTVTNFLAIVMYGARTQFINTSALAAPIMKCGPGVGTAVAFAGNNSLGGFGNGVTCPAPLIDLNGTGLLLELGAGFINDNAITGTGLMTMNLGDDNANGGQTAAQTFSFPAFAGTYAWNVNHRVRRKVLTTAVIATPYNATYAEVVPVDTSAIAITVNLPRANPAKGEIVTVVDKTGNAAANNITIAGTGGDTILGSASITANNDFRTYLALGNGTWLRIG